MAREQLPQRRGHDVFDFVFSRGPHDPVGTRYTAGLGRTRPGTPIVEIFLDCHKLASAMTDDARDIAVILSIALQHGVPLAAFRDAVTRLENGQPAGLAGRLLAEIEAREPEAFATRPGPDDPAPAAPDPRPTPDAPAPAAAEMERGQ